MKKNYIIVILSLVLIWSLVMWNNLVNDNKKLNTQVETLVKVNDSLKTLKIKQ